MIHGRAHLQIPPENPQVRIMTHTLPLIFALFLTALPLQAQSDKVKTVELNRDVRPILSDTCFQCHGPDKNKRKADLRLDQKESIFANRGDYQLIVPGKPMKSELYLRLISKDVRERMPPRRAQRKLTPEQIETVRQWIEQGAKWQKHWAFIPPKKADSPKVNKQNWARNPLDVLILARLEREGLSPSPEANRETLIRRVTLDLTGLPPTPAEVDAFVNDPAPNAYERLVDRLLNSPRFGEHRATRWLDAARYADTNGYQSDGERFMWRWRDWVIDAINHNKPFDVFTIEQIAGDLLPNPTLDQQIATGFNRNHRGNGEGGVIAEEYAVEYVVDRVDTTATTWLGLTMACARCHSHKYDPITQKEFYQVFAYFNNVPERGKAIKFGNSPPFIPAPTRKQQRQLKIIDKRLSLAESRFATLQPELAKAQREWEQTVTLKETMRWTWTENLLAQYGMDGNLNEEKNRQKPGTSQGGKPGFGKGMIDGAADLNGKSIVSFGDVGDFGYLDKITLAAWIRPDDVKHGIVLSRMADDARAEGYSVQIVSGHVQLNLVKRWLDDAIRVETISKLTPGKWYHVLATYDGSRFASGIQIYVNGKQQKLKVNLDELNQSFETKEPFRVGGGAGKENRFVGLMDDVRIYHDHLNAQEAELVATPDSIDALVNMNPNERTSSQKKKLRAYFLQESAPAEIRQAHQNVVRIREQRERLVETFPNTMVMVEMKEPRQTHLLQRGQYDKPGEKVIPGTPGVLPSLPKDVPNNRLGFARWLVSEDNPLTARVIVNRYWQSFFGTGIVKTVEDFGVQGEWPSHPELLDWLAVEFMSKGWDVKRMVRTMVTSATYRQSSRVTKDLLERDPANRLLARGPRLRLSAETIRDQALFVSGLMVERTGGPSVKPYQPKGLWEELAGKVYKQDHGASLYRRSLYTFWKRTIVPPTMVALDASMRESCQVRQSRTNTPLQALALLNETTFVEAARVLAERVLIEGGRTDEERVAYLFRLVTSRRPRPLEMKILQSGLARHRRHYRQRSDEAKKLVQTGEARRNPKIEVDELAAWSTLAGMVLNLDEVLNKE